MKLQILIDGIAYEVEVEECEDDVKLAAGSVPPARATIQSTVVPTTEKPAAASEDSSGVDESKVCRSPVAGIVIRVHAQPGDELRADDVILVLEAMKMETKVSAPFPGKLKSIRVMAGDAVKLNQILIEFE